MTGAYGVSTWTAIVAATGVILSAVYALTLYRRVMFGEITNPKLAGHHRPGLARGADLRAADRRHPGRWASQPGLVFNVTSASADAVWSTAYHAAIGAVERMNLTADLRSPCPELILAGSAPGCCWSGAPSPRRPAPVFTWPPALALVVAAVAAAIGAARHAPSAAA